MVTFSRGVRRWRLLRIAAVSIAAAIVAGLAAFVFAAISVFPSGVAVVAAVAALVVAGTGILYAWREPGR